MSILKSIRWRAEFLATRQALPLRQRLTYLIPRVGAQRSSSLFRELLRHDDAGEPYFELNDGPLYFLPDHPVDDVGMAIDAMLLVLREAFLWDQEYFHGEVQVRSGDTVIDLGAHVGTAAIALAAAAGSAGRVFAFEPVSARSLEGNLLARNLGNVRVVAAAAAHRSGKGDIEVTDKAINSSIARPLALNDPALKEIELLALDDFAERERLERLDFIKVDIEGAEEEAIRGAREVIARYRPRWSIASYHTDRHGDKQHPKLVKLLEDLGYHLHEVERRRIYAW